MGLFKRKPVGQLWVHYNQIGGYWQWRAATAGAVYHGDTHYLTEFEALDAGECVFRVYFPDLPVPTPRIFRTGADYYTAVIENGRWRK